MAGTTEDPTDPALKADPETGLQEKYLVLSEAERAAGFVRPVRRSYVHTRCGVVTTMSEAIAETYARDPGFYGATVCSNSEAHPGTPIYPVSEFTWDGTDEMVGS